MADSPREKQEESNLSAPADKFEEMRRPRSDEARVPKKTAEAEKTSSAVRAIPTSISHRAYSLVKVSYALFAVVFIYLFCDSSWFAANLAMCGLPIIFTIVALAHCLLVLFESSFGCRAFHWIFKGKPPVCYRTWVRLAETTGETETSGDRAPTTETVSDGEDSGDTGGDAGLRFGLRRIRLDIVDQLELTIWGNLVFKSRSVSGQPFDHALDDSKHLVVDTLLKIPFSAASVSDQKRLIEVVRRHRPDLKINKRLDRRLESKIVRGEELVKVGGAAFLCAVLIDLGYSTCFYLETQKHYFLSQSLIRGTRGDLSASRAEREVLASSEFQSAEKMRVNPMTISLVQKALFENGSAAGGVWQARGEALWYMGRRDEAIESIKMAHQKYPRSLKLMIQTARWMIATGKLEAGKRVLELAIEEHPESFLPRLYMMAVARPDSNEVKTLYDRYASELDEEVFGEEPWWPPGGNRFLSQHWYRDDMRFLLEKFLSDKKKEVKKRTSDKKD